MTNTHWRKLVNPDYLGAYSLDNGDGTYRSAVFTIVSAEQKDVTGPDGIKKKLVLELKESHKPMILNSTNARTLERLYKTAYIEQWIGRQFEVGVESVRVGPSREDALRIRKFMPRTAEAPKCHDCSGAIEAAGEMTAVQMVAFSQSRFGCPLCAACMKKRTEKAKQAAAQDEETPTEETSAVETHMDEAPTKEQEAPND